MAPYDRACDHPHAPRRQVRAGIQAGAVRVVVPVPDLDPLVRTREAREPVQVQPATDWPEPEAPCLG